PMKAVDIDSEELTSADLYHACENNNIEDVMRYIKSANINNIINENLHPSGSTALHIASHKGHNDIVKLLLKNGAFRSVTNKYGLTPFEEARTEATKDCFRQINTAHSFTGNRDDADYIKWVRASADLVKERDHFRTVTDSLKRYDHFATRDLLVEIINYYIKEYLRKSEGLSDANIKEIEYDFTQAFQQQDIIRYLIKAYTSPATNFHKVLNKHLAKYLLVYFDPNPVFIEHYRLVNCLKNIVALLVHHPDFINYHFIGITYRGMLMTENDLNQYQIGCQIMNLTFLSTSKNRKVAEIFSGAEAQSSLRKTLEQTPIQKPVMCQYKIRNIRTALNIELMSIVPEEEEVLITPFATFKVTSVKRHDPITNPSVLIEIEFEEYDASISEPNNLFDLIRHQHKRYSRIDRLVNPAKSFPIEQSYINLAIVDIKEQQEKEKKLRDAQHSDAIIGTFEEIHSAKSLINVKDIFGICKDQTKNVLVFGRAGIGKTTFCRYAAYQWATGAIWQQYKLVFLIPLRCLTESNYPLLLSGINYSLIDLVEKECFCHNLSDKDKTFLREQFDKSEVMWLLDGYDEIVQNVPAHLQYLFKQLLDTPHHILTSRPYSNTLSYAVQMTITGFADDNIAEYVKQFFDQIKDELNDALSKGQNLLNFLKLNPSIWGIAHIPVNLELICSLWADTDWSETKELTMTQLYDKITEWLFRRYMKNQQNIQTTQMTKQDVYNYCHKELAFLESIAFNAMKSNTIIIRPTLLKETLTETKCSLQHHPRLLHIGILKSFNHQPVGNQIEADKDYYFVHLSFQEYFAARYLVAILKDPSRQEANKFIKREKYNQRFALVLSFVCGLVTESNSELWIDTFWDTILGEPLDVVGIRHIQLVISCTEESSDNPNVPCRAELITYITRWLKYAVSTEYPVIRKQLTDSLRRSATLVHEPRVIATLIQLLQNNEPNVRKNVCNLISKLSLTKSQPELFHSLSTALLDVNKDVRMNVCEALGKLGEKAATTEVIRALVTALGDDKESVRWCTCKALGKISGKAPTAQVIRALVTALGDEVEYVRMNACETLGEMRDKAAITEVFRELVTALGDENEIVRRWACKALEEMGEKAPTTEVIRAFGTILGDENADVKIISAKTLGKIGEKAATTEVIRELVTILGDKDEYVRMNACKALGKMGGKAATAGVMRALVTILCHDKGCVRISACEALAKIGEKAATDEVIRALVTILGDEDDSVRWCACEALAEIGDKAAADEVIRALIIALRDENADVKINSCKALGKMNERAATDEVIRALVTILGDEDDSVRWCACEALAEIGEKAATTEVISALVIVLGDAKESVRRCACEALGKMNEKAVTVEVISALVIVLGDEKESVRRWACKALEEMGKRAATVEVVKALVTALGDGDRYVRMNACEALGKMGGKAATAGVMRALVTILCHDKGCVRISACEALAKIGEKAATDEVITALVTILGDEDEYVRMNACVALGKVGEKAATAEVIRALVTVLSDEGEYQMLCMQGSHENW
ncbi:unnamed protein product, partial [Didymodactylos carnosus]